MNWVASLWHRGNECGINVPNRYRLQPTSKVCLAGPPMTLPQRISSWSLSLSFSLSSLGAQPTTSFLSTPMTRTLAVIAQMSVLQRSNTNRRNLGATSKPRNGADPAPQHSAQQLLSRD